ncbi:DNA sulfur modification protein DndD [Alteromonas sp. 1_MG-2023]|uniref:DNA sulfur modification protein DndD n=1 Tax=Alteromonas sp. 1_MG-2023 TaxID=3062669 RepID=UPI0026E4475D|nr:DNA sulfur modification protein DndD [Alteromonas sp. 1_MG-2023]MDO6566502.1 DNA sulfur modification protein DndD [Alteromonas sp. 1_MG-2023]
MIFKELTMKNFRVFNGEHSLDVQPKKDGLLSKPIILFGGLNGAGKTSILTAIRLLLLGRRALSSIPNNKEYADYLSQQLNNKAKKEDNSAKASISLEFTHTHQGKHGVFTITRTWGVDGKENISFEHADEDSNLTSEQIQSIISEMIPPGIGDLFFFDGEKIAELAEDDTGVYLKEAVQKLLGLDIIERLNIDLDIYLNKESEGKASATIQKEITDLQKQKESFKAEADAYKEQANELYPKITSLRFEMSQIEKSIQERGGAFAITRDEEKGKQKSLEREIDTIKGKVLHELDGAFPLSLAPNAISGLFQQLESEKKLKANKSFNEQFLAQTEKLATTLSAALEADEAQVNELLKTYVETDGRISAEGTISLDISDREFHRLESLRDDSNESKTRLSNTLSELTAAESDLDSLTLRIQRAPDEKELVGLYERLRELDKAIVKEKDIYKDVLQKAQVAMAKALELAKRLEKLFNQQKNEKSLQKAVARVNSTQGALNEFSNKLTQLRVSQLEELFALAYRKLARKEDLKLTAKIDPETFDVALVDLDGMEINRKSLSAGEKQIFAFAILEALGKLSGKVLPVVVDTPLGRLDSKHRDKLIKHYFPEAGEQVILLSTDTEVDADFYSILQPEVSHAFEINFDEATRCSSVTEGYFWANKKAEIS